jgi:SAM-dependent methyltransferase
LNQLCVDFSHIVIDLMKERYIKQAGIEWQYADVRDMPVIATSSIEVGFDKGTMDAMIYGDPWNPPAIVSENTEQYLKEMARVLKDDGVFLYITFRQPHFVMPLLDRNDLWNIQRQDISDGPGTFDYYCFILTKRSKTHEEVKR